MDASSTSIKDDAVRDGSTVTKAMQTASNALDNAATGISKMEAHADDASEKVTATADAAEQAVSDVEEMVKGKVAQVVDAVKKKAMDKVDELKKVASGVWKKYNNAFLLVIVALYGYMSGAFTMTALTGGLLYVYTTFGFADAVHLVAMGTCLAWSTAMLACYAWVRVAGQEGGALHAATALAAGEDHLLEYRHRVLARWVHVDPESSVVDVNLAVWTLFTLLFLHKVMQWVSAKAATKKKKFSFKSAGTTMRAVGKFKRLTKKKKGSKFPQIY